jgi:hypothetical protein
MSIQKTILILSLIILITSTNVRAVWNPDADTNLKFKLDFQNNPTSTTTTDAVSGWVGTLMDYNTAGWDVWQESGKIGISADFNRVNDKLPYGAPNDCRLSVVKNGSNVLNFGDETVIRTWAFWFNTPDTTQRTFLRHEDPTTNGKFWDISLINGRLQFRSNKSDCKMVFSTVGGFFPIEIGAEFTLEIEPNQWHHVVFVIDRTTQDSSRIYVDGLVAELNYGDFPAHGTSGNINNIGNSRPLSVGANGTTQLPWSRQGEFDGMLDDIRVYHKPLNALEAHILSQWNTFVPHPVALLPIRNSDEVTISTDVNWIRCSAAQRLLFGDDPCNWDINTVSLIEGSGDVNKVTNTNLGGPLYIDTDYYWRVDSNNCNPGPLWMFHTITGKAANVSPADGQPDVAFGRVNLHWSAPDANQGIGRADYDVYFSTNENLVENKNLSVRIGHFLPNDGDPNIAVYPVARATYYWRVVSYYPHGEQADSDVWSFRTIPYPIVFNTSAGSVTYKYNGLDESIPAYTCKVCDVGGWRVVATGTYNANAGVAVFDFNDFDYDDLYDIIVLPEYTPSNDATAPPTPLVVDVNGSFYFDGVMDISGDDGDPLNKNASPKACCGGCRGPRREPDAGVDSPEFTAGYYYRKMEFKSRVGIEHMHYYYSPTTINRVNPANPSGYDVFGPGSPLTPPYKVGGGGGYGGKGGDSGRGYFHGISASGRPYGDKEVPVPFGGSAGSWGMSAPGGAGGGGVEIDAAGNVTFGSNAKIYAEGGTNPYISCRPAGGGAGGSVKIIAGGNITITSGAVISVNGGDGGDDCEKGSNTGGGGAGGRIAIFYGQNYTNNGIVTANGGDKGVVVNSGTYPHHNGLGLSFDGDDGTIYIKSYAEVSPRKASAPTPRDGDYMVYAPSSPTALTLRWYSGYNVTAANDTVYCDTSNPPTTQIGNPVPATRGQQSSTIAKNIYPDTTYYMKVVTSGAGFAPVYSDIWSFKTVGWQCQEPNWAPSYTYPTTDPNLAGWPAWDHDHDCTVNYWDLWYFSGDWQADRGGIEYILDIGQLIDVFLSEWMTCRARTNNGCLGWPLTPDWIPSGYAP